MESESVDYRRATSSDLDLVKRTLYTALSWDPDDPIPPFEKVVDHPKIAVYHAGWIRPGDEGVVAETGDMFAGMAYCRLFADGGDSQGFYDEETPEMAIGVESEFRGLGIGRALIHKLSDLLTEKGVSRLSLSVSVRNPAVRLYESLGYREVRRHNDSLVMVADLRGGH